MEMGFLTKAVGEMDVSRRLADAVQLARETGYRKITVIVDMLRRALRYGAGPMDYRLFELYTKTPRQRESYITRGINNQLVKKWNDPRFCDRIDDKVQFHRYFSEFTGREFLPVTDMTPEALKSFCEGKERILYKPAHEGCGRGIEAISPGEWAEETLYAHLKEKREGLVEQMVIQHPVLTRINPDAINTVRVVTIRDGKKCTPIFAFLRMGTRGRVVDNLNSGGIAAKINLEDGSITLPAAGKDGKRHTVHPGTGTPIMGVTIPMWDRVLKVTEAASAVVPQVGYVGWDVAVRADDVILIEGNSYPGHDILQLPAYTPDGFGLKPVVQPFL